MSSSKSTTRFKLKRDSLTRRVTFDERPSWALLAAKISELFAIAPEQIAVAYIDADADEVTLSSSAELNEYYKEVPAGEEIKFFVRDLSSRTDKSLPETPRSAFRNTFGVNIDEFEIEDDWQPLPPMGGGIYVPVGGSTHAFIQVVESDVNDDVESNHSTADFGTTVDKGKGKAVDPSPVPSVADKLVDDEASLDEPTVHETVPLVETVDVDDPPLPTIEPATAPQPSIANDVATLLTTLTNVMSSHPELSEGLRNIVQNATNGTYWNVHRVAVSQAAGEFMQATGDAAEDLRRRGEDEAGRRVAEALTGMLRTFSQVLGPGETTAADEPVRTSTPTADPSPFWQGPRRDPGGHHGGHWGRPVPPPPPPPPFPAFASVPPSFWPRFGPPPPPGPPPRVPPPPHVPPPPVPPAPEAASKPTAQDLKARVDAAKLLYKAEKERYRAECEERKKARDARAAAEAARMAAAAADVAVEEKPEEPPAPPAPKPVAHLVSAGNRKVGYPQLEMYSVPHRHNTYHGHPSRRHYSQDMAPESSTDRAVHRITRRLAAMGITDKAHPTLPSKIKEQLPDGPLSDEAENNIVSTLVEELVFISSPKPVASGSGLHNDEVPGAWP
ncbi:hypothetical protein FB45DRAFT_1058943 [Roridomyces roridus]|uniref:PB1 domain-containing protein n=1 Tax=Roridomyces roridus TaxID=1738132 RepID=A0AAD7FLS1_9AGAR|nr:hypothetical protein FB45DRAFT_1058943 [Roridomyces roridus]